MAKKPRNAVPTSVILTNEQKAFIKAVADREGRSFSSMVRFIVLQWVNFHSKKEKRSPQPAAAPPHLAAETQEQHSG